MNNEVDIYTAGSQRLEEIASAQMEESEACEKARQKLEHLWDELSDEEREAVNVWARSQGGCQMSNEVELYLSESRKLDELHAAGKDDSPEYEEICSRLDFVWAAMTDEDRKRVGEDARLRSQGEQQ